MRTILPGKPQAQLQAVSSTQWRGKRFVVYISGNALIILGGPHDLIQTIYLDECKALHAVTIDEKSGKVATSSSGQVYVYKPYGIEEGVLKWSLQLSLPKSKDDCGTSTLSWGSEEELLVGSGSLKLYQTHEEGHQIWDRKLPKPVSVASFSHDAGYIASIGLTDRLIKLWRRQSFNSDETRFDFTYLPHPSAVVNIQWRIPPPHKHHHHESNVDDVLFSVCVDGYVRIWAASDPHGLQGMQLWAEIDMQQSLQPRQLGDVPNANERLAFFIGSQDFASAAEFALQTGADHDNASDHALEHLAEISKNKPDVCVVLDRRGNMSAWGLENVGCKAKKPTDIFNIAHIENFDVSCATDFEQGKDNVQFLSFCTLGSFRTFILLAHHFDGRITWHDGALSQVFDPSPRRERLQFRALWSGHDAQIQSLSRDATGVSIWSLARNNTGLVWKHQSVQGVMTVQRQSLMKCSQPVSQVRVLDAVNTVVLYSDMLSLWNTQGSLTTEVSSSPCRTLGKPMCLLELPGPLSRLPSKYIAVVDPSMSGVIWEITTNAEIFRDKSVQVPKMEEFARFKVQCSDAVALILPRMPMGSLSVGSSPCNHRAKETAVTVTEPGIIHTWTTVIDQDISSVTWSCSFAVHTNIRNPSLGSASSAHKVALVDKTRSRLTLWDTQNKQLEYDRCYDSLETIHSLEWSPATHQQALLAVSFASKVVVLAQLRFDYVRADSAWAPMRVINIKELTSQPIIDSTWLGNGGFIIAAGSQMYVYDENVPTNNRLVKDLDMPIGRKGSLNIFELTDYLNGPLAFYSPRFLLPYISLGRFIQVQKILVALHSTLKYYVEGEELDCYLGLTLQGLGTNYETKEDPASIDDDENSTELTDDIAMSLKEKLAEIALPNILRSQQSHLVSIIDTMSKAQKSRRSMDDNAMRFYISYDQHMVRKQQANTSGISWKEYAWAFQSNSQEIMIDLISRYLQGELLWQQAKECGMFMWMTDLTALRAQFELIARNEYTKTDDKNPIDCSLYYIALRKENVLLGLWRLASWNREQAATQRLLKNNFSEARWKTAALKNAYALLGKRRYEYAAAWFLLAGKLQDAVNVCIHQMDDMQLGIAIARVYDGDESEVLRCLLKEKVLPRAAHIGDRWQAVWAFWMLGEQSSALRALVEPLEGLIKIPELPDTTARSYLANDPALIVLYEQLRAKVLQTSKRIFPISPQAEWQFVMRTARQYIRMGCHILALELVSNWRFAPPIKGVVIPENIPREEDKKKRRRGSSKTSKLQTPKSPTKEKPKPTMFKEPEANNLLDSFGF